MKATSLLRYWFCLLSIVCLQGFQVQGQDYEQIWQLGLEDNSLNEFHQESFAQNAPPGSPTALDNDYYFAGQYAAVGIVAQNEPWENFERALTGSELQSRIYFNLTPGQAAPGNNLRITFKMFGYNTESAYALGPVPLVVKWNENEVLSDTLTTDPQMEQATFTAGTVNAVAGENLLTIERDASGNAWVCFDFIRLEVQKVDPTAGLLDTFTASAAQILPGQQVTLSWKVDPQATLVIDQGVGDVTAKTTNGVGSIQISPAETTTYTLTSTKGADSKTASVTVIIGLRQLLWQLGYEDNNQIEFAQEAGGVNPAPGSPTAIDNDYYFAGQYPDPIGLLTTNESFGNFERALTAAETATRIHFNLTEAQAAAANNLYVTFRLYGFNTDACCNADPTAWISVNWNDTEILSTTEVTDPTTTVIGPVGAGSVGAVPGANVLTISRTAEGNAWIQFDFARAEVEMIDPTAGLIVSFDADSKSAFPGQKVTLTWQADPLATLGIDQGVGNVTGNTVNGIGSIQVSPTQTTTYTLTATRGGATLKAQVLVTVGMIKSFTANRSTIQKGEKLTLNWQVDPAASVILTPTFGDVGAYASAGVGALTVTPAASTTYTLAVSKPGYSAQASVIVTVNPFGLLWRLGNEDNSQLEFGQEGGGVNAAPGSPTALDNDYYFAGTYSGLDPQVVETNELSANFERALKPSEALTRIHFNLNAAQAAPENIYRVTFRLYGFNTDAAYPLGNLGGISVAWNDVQVMTNMDLPDPSLLQTTFASADVGAAPGENTLTIQRSAQGNEWVQFDYVKLEAFNPNVIWQLGYEDNSQADFTQEAGGVNAPPGSPTALDNDYYFAGTYAALNPQIVETNEPWVNFERALTSGDAVTRIHFNLTPEQAQPENVINLNFKLFSFNNDPGSAMGVVPWLTAKWNDTVVLTNAVETDPTFEQASFKAGAVGAVAGENTLTIARSPEGNAWIQFDYIKTEVSTASGLRIASMWDAFGFTITWPSLPGRTYQVQASSDLKLWTTLAASYPAGGATDVLTSYTDTTAKRGEGMRFYRIVDNMPQPLFADDFESGIGEWEAIDQSGNGTAWELGTPAHGPGAAHSGTQVFATGLTANYNPSTDILLRSPVINLAGVTNAVLEFWNYRDLEAPQGTTQPDFGAVEILDENGDPLPDLTAVLSKAGASYGWRKQWVRLPDAAMDRAIRLQFHFYSDGVNEGAGWFIDDVTVTPK